jgi:Uncharacterized protein conserved in bacteria (DUF2332)
MEPYAPIAEQYADFARWSRDESPCFSAWARGVADDPDVLARLSDLPRVKQQPNLVFAAARWHGVPAPGPYAGLRDALLGDAGSAGSGQAAAIRATILARSTQTNEVGRLATLTPAFATIAGDEPLALVEVGASAGLCLYPDRYSYAWATEAGLVTAGEGPRLQCEVTGRLPDHVRPPEVRWRAGIDLNPLSVTDDDAMAWLANLVWPEQEARRERLRVAVEVARADPPAVLAGDLLTELPAVVDQAASAGRVVVFHSAVVAYLEAADRARFQDMMTGLVEGGRCHWVSNEGANVLPGVTATGPPVPDGLAAFVLGVDGRTVAWAHGHGRSMTWLAAGG